MFFFFFFTWYDWKWGWSRAVMLTVVCYQTLCPACRVGLDATVDTAGVITANCHPSDADHALSHTNTPYHTVWKHTCRRTLLFLHTTPYPPPLHSSPIFTESLCASSSPLPRCMIWSELCQAELAWIKRLRKPWLSGNPRKRDRGGMADPKPNNLN